MIKLAILRVNNCFFQDAIDSAVNSTVIDQVTHDKIKEIEEILKKVKDDVFDKFNVNLNDVIPFDKIDELKKKFDDIKTLLDAAAGSGLLQEMIDLVNKIIEDFNNLYGKYVSKE